MNSTDIRICFIGDSLVQGTGDPACLGWPGRLLTRLNRNGFVATGYNLGIRRDTSQDIKRRWQAECERRLPEQSENYLVFSFGVNDTSCENNTPRVTMDNSVNNLQQILGEATTLFPTLMIGLTPVCEQEQSTRIAELDQAYQSAADALSTPYLSLFEQLSQSEVWFAEMRAGDGSHPGQGGYQQISELIGAWPAWWFRKD